MQVHPRAIIDHSALQQNLACVWRHAPESQVWAVIKANGYGHGMVPVATTLETADGLAVWPGWKGVRHPTHPTRFHAKVLFQQSMADFAQSTD